VENAAGDHGKGSFRANEDPFRRRLCQTGKSFATLIFEKGILRQRLMALQKSEWTTSFTFFLFQD